MFDRRRFLASTLSASAALSLGSRTPALWSLAAEASDSAGERILVVVQLSGGNDGLNTVVPHRDPAYQKARPTLALSETRLLKIDDDQGFHPALSGFARLLEAGQLAIQHGVGYASPNRSHFESMDIWHTCRRKDEARGEGWLGRFLDQRTGAGDDAPAIHLGAEKQPLALASARVRVPSIRSIEAFQLGGGESEAIGKLAAAPREGRDDLLGFVQDNATSALALSQRVQEAARGDSPITYPATPLAGQLRTVAQMIDAGLRTRVYYLELAGFDTHSQQDGAHAGLLRQLGDGVDAFCRDLEARGHLQRTTLFAFSEFGRRVAENASEGTDHGAAAPVFLAGGGVRSGVHGGQPSLDDLDDGDLKFHTDFRRVYATLLDQWLGAASKEILGDEHEPLPLLG